MILMTPAKYIFLLIAIVLLLVLLNGLKGSKPQELIIRKRYQAWKAGERPAEYSSDQVETMLFGVDHER